MSTQKQHDANVGNAQHSSGPRSTAGKSTASLNAFKHGFCADDATLYDDPETSQQISDRVTATSTITFPNPHSKKQQSRKSPSAKSASNTSSAPKPDSSTSTAISPSSNTPSRTPLATSCTNSTPPTTVPAKSATSPTCSWVSPGATRVPKSTACPATNPASASATRKRSSAWTRSSPPAPRHPNPQAASQHRTATVRERPPPSSKRLRPKNPFYRTNPIST